MNIYLGKWTFIALIIILFHQATYGQSSQSTNLPISEIENFSSSEASNLTSALAPIGIERDGITYYEDSGAFNFLARLKHGEVLDLIDRFCDKDSIDPECITSGTCPCGDKIIAGLAFIPKWTTFDADSVERSESEKSFYTEGLGVALVLFGQKNGFPNAIFIAGVEDQSLEDVVKSGIDKNFVLGGVDDFAFYIDLKDPTRAVVQNMNPALSRPIYLEEGEEENVKISEAFNQEVLNSREFDLSFLPFELYWDLATNNMYCPNTKEEGISISRAFVNIKESSDPADIQGIPWVNHPDSYFRTLMFEPPCAVSLPPDFVSSASLARVLGQFCPPFWIGPGRSMFNLASKSMEDMILSVVRPLYDPRGGGITIRGAKTTLEIGALGAFATQDNLIDDSNLVGYLAINQQLSKSGNSSSNLKWWARLQINRFRAFNSSRVFQFTLGPKVAYHFPNNNPLSINADIGIGVTDLPVSLGNGDVASSPISATAGLGLAYSLSQEPPLNLLGNSTGNGSAENSVQKIISRTSLVAGLRYHVLNINSISSGNLNFPSFYVGLRFLL